MTLEQQRYNRAAQCKHRGSRQSYRTQHEDALIILAWQAGRLSEGQAMRALATDRIGAREERDAAIDRGTEIGLELWNAARRKAEREAGE